MSFNKPFRAVPLKERRRPRQQEPKAKNPLLAYLGGAVLVGGAAGIGSVALSEGGLSGLATRMRPMAVSMGWARAREPQAGDHWPGCNAARAAGTAPIYAGEPGYREEMDGDGDGIACEPYRR